MDDRITINGISYIKEHPAPDCVKFYFMHDSFYFSRLKGSSLEEIAATASALSGTPAGAWGSLCPAILMCGNKEVRRVGPMVHAECVDGSRRKWDDGIQQWIKALSADQDIVRLLAEKGQS